MTVTDLSAVSFDELLDCFLPAFDNYYVKMPSDRDYYRNRWKAARVNFRLSYGIFDEGKLVGFIIHAIDKRNGIFTAFNTGTGILPAYRGRRLVQSLYAYALKDLKAHGVEKSTLEVITENNRAIRAYQSAGFKVSKNYRCFTGDIRTAGDDVPEVREVPLKEVDWEMLPNQQYYSWDFQKETILQAPYRYFQLMEKGLPESFFIINPGTKMVAQLDVIRQDPGAWQRLFAAIQALCGSIRVINVDERLTDKMEQLRLAGLENSLNQYEMELSL